VIRTAIIVLVLCGSAAARLTASEHRGVIDDPDGFTNLRARPSETAAIVARVNKGEIFKYDFKWKESWYKVTLASGKTGWMHQSRIRMHIVPKDLVVAENDEIIQYARGDGVDYRALLAPAKKGDEAALERLLEVGCDGAACEKHDEIVVGLIHILGDEKFAKFFSRRSPELRNRVGRLIENSHSIAASEPIDYMKRHFPKTSALMFPTRDPDEFTE
jgi:hypothetical protein